MNKLFIGPYKQNNYLGILSKIYLDHIFSESRGQGIVSRNFGSLIGAEDAPVLPSERIRLDSCGTLIQNLPLDQMVIDKRFRKNILVPNISASKKLNPIHYTQKIELADLILVNNHIDYKKIIALGVAPSKVQQFSIGINPTDASKKIDLGIFNSFYKFYFVGDYAANQDTIKTLIISFCDTFRNQDCFLILWIACTTQQRSEILDFYKKIKTSLNMTNSLDNILFICRPIDYGEVAALHNSSDTYLALNSDYYPFIDEQLAIAFNRQIINREQITESYSPDLSNNSGDYIGSIDTDSLSSKMLDRYNNKTAPISKKHKNKPTLYSFI